MVQRSVTLMLLIFGLATVVRGQPIPLSETQISTYTSSTNFDPQIDIDDAGNAVVIWRAEHPDVSHCCEISGRRFSPAGSPVGGETRINNITDDHQRNPVVAMDDDDGTFIAVWNNTHRVKARRYRANGQPEGPEFAVSSSQNTERYPSVAVAGSGRFVVAWQSYDDGDSRSISARRFHFNGTPNGAEFVVNTTTTDDQRNPEVAISRDGSVFVVVWENDQGVDRDIFAQVFAANGAKIGGEVAVNTYTPGRQEHIAVAMDEDGDFVVAWHGSIANGVNGTDIVARRFRSNGTAKGGEFQVNATSNDKQETSAMAIDNAGNFIVVWDDHWHDQIRGRYYLANGTLFGGEVSISNAPVAQHDESNPSVAIHPDGRFAFVTWESDRNYQIFRDIWMNRLGLAVFTDGFESGSATRWTSATGNP